VLVLNCCHSSLTPNVGQRGGQSEQPQQQENQPPHRALTPKAAEAASCHSFSIEAGVDERPTL